MTVPTEAFEIAVESEPNIQDIRNILSKGAQELEHIVEM